MHERHVTAEEVLGLFREYREWMIDSNADLETALNLHDAFVDAYKQWQASQGPVTREWFCERFGLDDVKCKMGCISFWQVKDRMGIAISDESGDCIEIHNPTREQIEVLVKMLGGTQ